MATSEFTSPHGNRAGGSAGAGGYSYQARAIAFAAIHILAQQRLNWVTHSVADVPTAVAVETGGPGDDLCLTLSDETRIEIQAKKGLDKDKLWGAILPLYSSLRSNPTLYCVLLVDTSSSKTIREDLRHDIERLSMGRSDDLKQITTELLDRIRQIGDLDYGLFTRLRIVHLDLTESACRSSITGVLGSLLGPDSNANVAWTTLESDALALISSRGNRDRPSLIALLSREARVFLSAN